MVHQGPDILVGGAVAYNAGKSPYQWEVLRSVFIMLP